MKRMYWTGKPDFAFKLWAMGSGDVACASDMELPISPLRRMFWKVRGYVLIFLFGWWWWAEVELTAPSPIDKWD
jgi:hypothetical protein